MTRRDDAQELQELLAHFDTAMLVTRTPDQRMTARPMHVVRAMPDHELWFVMSTDSGKVDEIQADPAVLLTMQSTTRYLSLFGRAALSQDRALIHKLWEPAWKAWFPAGADDPTLALLRVEGRTADFWDLSGGDRLRYLFEAGRAILQGRSVGQRTDAGAQRHVELGASREDRPER